MIDYRFLIMRGKIINFYRLEQLVENNSAKNNASPKWQIITIIKRIVDFRYDRITSHSWKMKLERVDFHMINVYIEFKQFTNNFTPTFQIRQKHKEPR